VESDRTLRKWYRIINRRFFDGACTNSCCVRWANEEEEAEEPEWEEKYFGQADVAKDGCHEFVIVLSRVRNVAISQRLSTLAHEMIHVATKLRDDHGPVFEQWRQLISDRGIFKKHALRRNLTIF